MESLVNFQSNGMIVAKFWAVFIFPATMNSGGPASLRRGPKDRIFLSSCGLCFVIRFSIECHDPKPWAGPALGPRWWLNVGLGEKLSFARDRLMENFLWTIGMIFEPEFGYCRRMSTKVNVLLTTIDNVYDVYGTLDELELFTDAVERWDVNAIEQLPDYMKICLLTLYNTINELAYDTFKEQGLHILPYLKKFVLINNVLKSFVMWADLCKAYLLEAKWYYSGYTRTLREYIANAWISATVPVMLGHAHFLSRMPITTNALKALKECPNIIQLSAMIVRLADDLGTSSDEFKRGDVPKSIQCYMHETGVSKVRAREHIRYLISEMWKKINEE
ncbi:hypothetical protein JCGZ_22207 [Jatropha curcas]|uniref:Terpene synthase metal-binding domain-containing protein n=1 Tax=Jatropha curcas TaxID=180498 RepID=A0A067JQ70_JATCU|nr:hypothetical protein JCGZ_22207 [Jatropha curcas]